MSAKKHAIAIAEALADLETAIEANDHTSVQEKVAELHKRLRHGLKANSTALGLSDDDVAEIDNTGPMRRSGEPK